jgi:glycosyltransferase involved in cell wall biosynthesis
MNIVHTEASCGWGGQELRILSEAAGLIERGHQVTLLCPEESNIFREAVRHGVPAVALPIARKRPAGLLAMRRWLASHPVDVVNTHSSTDTWLTALACASMRQAPPIVRTRHISAPIPQNATSRWLYSSATRHVVTTGEALRLQLIEENGLAPEQVTSVPTGIDPVRFAPVAPETRAALRKTLGLDPAGRYIGIVATLRSWKGHTYLLEAFADFGRPDWKLLIVGNGPQYEALQRRIGELGLGDRVILAGQQDHPEQWLQAMDIFCLPSYANEGVPQAVLQAMLTALPIVTTPVGAIAEAVAHEKTGLIVAPRNPLALANAFARLADDPAFASALGLAAQCDAQQRFTREVMLDRMERIFADVCRA